MLKMVQADSNTQKLEKACNMSKAVRRRISNT